MMKIDRSISMINPQNFLSNVCYSQKERITISFDKDILEFFKKEGKKGYQTRINNVLRDFTRGVSSNLEDLARKVIREELLSFKESRSAGK